MFHNLYCQTISSCAIPFSRAENKNTFVHTIKLLNFTITESSTVVTIIHISAHLQSYINNISNGKIIMLISVGTIVHGIIFLHFTITGTLIAMVINFEAIILRITVNSASLSQIAILTYIISLAHQPTCLYFIINDRLLLIKILFYIVKLIKFTKSAPLYNT